MRRPIEDGFSLLAGAGLGMALMYLFDPEVGKRRRQQINRAAADLLDSTGETLGTAFSGASSKAGEFMHRVSDQATQSSRDWATNRAQELREQAEGYIRKLGNRVPHDREYHPIGQTACALGSLALGAGLIYFLDSSDGPRRRSVLRDKFIHTLNETGQFFRVTGRHIRNRLTGQYHEFRSMVSHEQVGDEQLAERVRSRMGRVSSHLGDVRIQCDNNRCILAGTAPGEEIESIVHAAASVRGVFEVDNQLSARTAPTESAAAARIISPASGEQTG